MGHEQTIIRKLDLAFRPHYKLDWNVLLTFEVDSPLIRVFAILMKVN